MKLSQYIYGRKPKAGLQVITRSRELPFFVQSWFESPRYGAAPVRSTPDRIWAQRYELQCFENGAAISCMYPLKQTEVPCSEQQEPYIRGITPAVQHLLAGNEDVDELLNHVDAALHFDGFHQIDDIYRLPNSFAEPVDFIPAPCAPAPLNDQERALCVDMAASLWQAFMARKDNKMAVLAQRTVKLIVPAGEPADELEHQRRLVCYVLKLLPPYIRRWTSVTLNMDVESETYPTGSALYSMVRATEDSKPVGMGPVFDAEKMLWTPAASEERAYFMAREQGGAVIGLDALVDLLPCKYDLSFHVRLQTLLEQALSGSMDQQTLQAFIAAENLAAFTPNLCQTLAACILSSGSLNRQQLAVLWTLMSLDSGCAALLNNAQCSVDECIAIITRNQVLTAFPGVFDPDLVFFNLIARLSAADPTPLSDEAVQSIRLWLSTLTQHSDAVEMLLNVLIQYNKLVIDNTAVLLTWLENSFICKMKLLANSPTCSALLDGVEPQELSRLLLTAIGLGRDCPWTTAVERLLIEWFDRHEQLPAWDETACLTAAQRAVSLQDGQLLWPMMAMRAAAALQKPSEACLLLLRDARIRSIPQVQPYAQQFIGFVHAQNVQTLREKLHTPADILNLAGLWADITNGEPLQLNAEQWASLLPAFEKALENTSIVAVLDLLYKLQQKNLPTDCMIQIETAATSQMALALPTEDLRRLSWQQLGYVKQLINIHQPTLLPAAQQVMKLLAMLEAVGANPTDRNVFANVRKDLPTLTSANRTMLNDLFAQHMPDLAASILLRFLSPDNIIDWNYAFGHIMRLYGLPAVAPNDIPRCSVEEYEVFMTMLCGLYRYQYPIGALLTPFDCQTLSEWLISTQPRLIKQLMNEQKKYGDLPYELVEGLQLYPHRR